MSSKVIVLITAVGCVVAAGAGSYLAVRSSAPASASQLAAEAAPPQVATSDSAAGSSPAPVVAQEPKASAEGQGPATTPARPSDTQSPAPPQPTSPARPATNPAEATAAETPVIESAAPDQAAVAVEPVPLPVATAPTESFEVVEVPAEAVLGIRIDTPISTETSKLEDRVVGRLTRDVSVEGRVVIHAGAEVHGTVTLLERGGRVRERARLGVRFTSLVIDDKIRLPIDTEPIFREGDAKASETTARVGASAVIGGIIGGMLGGKRGAAIGGAAGAAGGTAVVMAGDRSEATLAAGTNLTVRLSAAVSVTVER